MQMPTDEDIAINLILKEDFHMKDALHALKYTSYWY